MKEKTADQEYSTLQDCLSEVEIKTTKQNLWEFITTKTDLKEML